MPTEATESGRTEEEDEGVAGVLRHDRSGYLACRLMRMHGFSLSAAPIVVHDDLRRAAERIAAAPSELASQFCLLEATLSSIPDFVYAFDPQGRS